MRELSTTSHSSLHARPRERRLTRRGVLWLGLRCDVRCKFCYDEHLLTRDKIWISVEDAKRALNKFRYYYHNTFVDFMGGEPTLHPHVLEIVCHAAGIGLRPTVITHGMHLADPERAQAYATAGIHDFLVSVHGVGDTVASIHRRSVNNFERQMRALDNLRALGIPFRLNVTLIRDNVTQLEAIAHLAAEKGARVVNFLTFNPYFEWTEDPVIEFQVRHSECAPFLTKAIDVCTRHGVEANVRYMPPCQLPGYEAHVYTGFQLPYDPHEWDYNSWYDMGHAGTPSRDWYLQASQLQRERHRYVPLPACNDCSIRAVCDGFHVQYAARWGGGEARPYPGPQVTDPCHFVKDQQKIRYADSTATTDDAVDQGCSTALGLTQFQPYVEHRAGVREDGGRPR